MSSIMLPGMARATHGCRCHNGAAFGRSIQKVFKPECRVTEGGGVALQAFVESAIASDVIAKTMMEQCEQDALRNTESRDALIVEAMQLADMLPSNVQELVAVSKDLQEVLGVYRQVEEGKKHSTGPR